MTFTATWASVWVPLETLHLKLAENMNCEFVPEPKIGEKLGVCQINSLNKSGMS